MSYNLEDLNKEIERVFGNNLEASTNIKNVQSRIIETTELSKPEVVIIDENAKERDSLIKYGIELLENNNDYFEIKLDNNYNSINLCKMLISIFGSKKMDFLLEKKTENSFSIKFSNSSNRKKVITEEGNTFTKFALQMANVYNPSVDYNQSLKSLPNLSTSFDIFYELFSYDGDLKLAYKYRDDKDQFAISTNQIATEMVLANSNIPFKKHNDHINMVIGEGLTNQELSVMLERIYNNISDVKKLEPSNYSLKKTENNLNEAAKTSPFLLVIITLAELFAVIISAYFLCS